MEPAVYFCGEPITKKSYCACHYAIAYRGQSSPGRYEPRQHAGRSPHEVNGVSSMRQQGQPAVDEYIRSREVRADRVRWARSHNASTASPLQMEAAE
jgi:hypothetical protein